MKSEITGWKTEHMSMIPLTRRKKTDKTAITTLKFVVLICVSIYEELGCEKNV